MNEKLVQESQKQVIKKFKRRKVYARFKGNIWAADLAEMGSLFSLNHIGKNLFCAIDVFTKYNWVKPLKDKKANGFLHGFVEILNESKSLKSKVK